MATFFELQKAALDQMEKAAALAEKLGYETQANSIRENCEQMLRRELIVVAAGEVKRGKSSLLNALLNETEPLCPVDAEVCTNAVTVIRYGEREIVQVHIADPEAEEGGRIETITRSQIGEYVSESKNPGNYKNVFRIDVQIPNALLKEGVIFVDTPGVGSMNPLHAEITYSYLPNADLLLFVTDSQSPMSETEINFLKRGYSYCNTVVYPLTKKDLSNDPDVILNGNRKKISDALSIPEEQVKIIPVSSTAKLKCLRDSELTERARTRIYRNSNYQELEETIWTSIARRQSELKILPYLRKTEEEMQKILDSLAGEYLVLGNHTASVELAEKLKKLQEELEQMQADSADWKNNLRTYFRDKRSSFASAQTKIKVAASNKVSSSVRQLEKDICDEENYTSILAEVNAIITQGVADFRTDMTDSLSQKIQTLRHDMGLSIPVYQTALDSMISNPANHLDVNIAKKTFGEQFMIRAKEASKVAIPLSAAGAAIGAIVGSIEAGPLGYVVGVEAGRQAGAAVASFFVGIAGLAGACQLVFANSQYDEKDINEVKEKLNQHISITLTEVAQTIKNALDDLEKSTVEELCKQLKLQADKINRDIAIIKRNMAAEEAQIPVMKKALDSKISSVKKNMTEMIDLQKEIADCSIDVGTETKLPEKEHAEPKPSKPAEPAPAKKKTVSYDFM